MRRQIETSGNHGSHRSTLAYANEHRPWQLYQQVFLQLLQRCQSQGMGKKKLRLFPLQDTKIHLAYLEKYPRQSRSLGWAFCIEEIWSKPLLIIDKNL